MSQSASPRSRSVFIGVVVIVVVAVIAIALWNVTGDDDEAEPLTAATQETTPPTTATPTPEATTTPTPDPTPTPTSTSPTCEGPDTVFNEDGTEKDTLLPDCGVAPVDAAEQQKTGLSLACGGSYPVILYKTTTTDAKTSICGRDSSGEDFRFVTKPTGGDVVDLKGRYDPDLDAFVASQDGTSYAVQAYDGTLLVTKDGKKSKQKASDWISLDNEADTD